VATYVIGEGEVHVWRAALDTSPQAYAACERVLGPAERDRAVRFHTTRDRRRFVVSHAVLRRLLAGYCRTDPLELRFAVGQWGKPALCPPHAELCFNISHSGELALYALTRQADIGVDVEHHREELAQDEIAARFFAPAEAAALRALPPQLRTDAFFRCWTCKEAFIKARGEGFSLPLNRFVVSFEPGNPPALLSVDGNAAAVAEWNLHEVPVPEGYTAALAVKAPSRYLTIRDWHHPAPASG
jgi:4'-phosphopantetheinyl transferase